MLVATISILSRIVPFSMPKRHVPSPARCVGIKSSLIPIGTHHLVKTFWSHYGDDYISCSSLIGLCRTGTGREAASPVQKPRHGISCCPTCSTLADGWFCRQVKTTLDPDGSGTAESVGPAESAETRDVGAGIRRTAAREERHETRIYDLELEFQPESQSHFLPAGIVLAELERAGASFCPSHCNRGIPGP
ncbi:hypothetical protein LY78DRAFT_88442 [Colletotrichum sublineola]|nr:hypothetical protein LY78DRAFT_88442 [Colletotrichum sublineola]